MKLIYFFNNVLLIPNKSMITKPINNVIGVEDFHTSML